MSIVIILTEKQKALFWSKVHKTESCWLWLGCTDISGYGRFHVGSRINQSHRISWVIENGEIPDGKCVCHTCDVRECVNPSHLFIGTKGDNARDMISKRRDTIVGSRNHQHKLTEENIPIIRNLLREGKTQSQVAAIFGVSRDAISDIKRNRRWRHVCDSTQTT